MAMISLREMLCSLPMISSPDDMEGMDACLQMSFATEGASSVEYLLYHVYDPILDIKLYASDVLSTDFFDRIRLVQFLSSIFGQDNYILSGKHEIDFWRSKCRCQPQSPFHLRLGNEAIDAVYESYGLPSLLRHIMDRILCLGYQPEGSDILDLYHALQLNEDMLQQCLEVRTALLRL